MEENQQPIVNTNHPVIEETAREAKSEKELQEEKLSRKRIFFALVIVAIVLVALIIWEIVDLFGDLFVA